jgi:hypothetical protein
MSQNEGKSTKTENKQVITEIQKKKQNQIKYNDTYLPQEYINGESIFDGFLQPFSFASIRGYEDAGQW